MFRSAMHVRVAGVLFMGVFLLSFGLRSAHGWLSHADEHLHEVCDADHNGRQKHIHDDRYKPDHCQLCAFFLSASVLPERITLRLPARDYPFMLLPFAAVCWAGKELSSNRGRAPPTDVFIRTA